MTNAAPVTTYGPNDMALDNWGHVDEWIAKEAVTTHGPSAIGFVQFGELGTLHVKAPIETHGNGARGFNLYDGSLEEAVFDSIVTHADGGIGIQVSRRLPQLSVHGDVMTEGGEANSLVKGVVQPLKAIAMSIQEEGHVDEIEIGGQLSTSGNDVNTLHVQGKIGTLHVERGIHAQGNRSNAVVKESSDVDLDGVEITAKDGERIRT